MSLGVSMEDWGAVRDRLLGLAESAAHDGDPQSAADIRVALERVTDQASEIVALRLACNVSAADLQAIGNLCGMRDDEYPLKAVERLRQRVEELEQIIAALRGGRE